MSAMMHIMSFIAFCLAIGWVALWLLIALILFLSRGGHES